MVVGVTVVVYLPKVLTPKKSKLRPSLSHHPANSYYYMLCLGWKSMICIIDSSLVHQTTHRAPCGFPLTPFMWGTDISTSRKWNPKS